MDNNFLSGISKYLQGVNFYNCFIKCEKKELDGLRDKLKDRQLLSEKEYEQLSPEFVFNCLLEHYRNDVIYKIELIDQIEKFISELHDSYIFNEFKYGTNIADIAIFNGNSISYEIKSDLDDAVNVTEQFNSYISLFDYSYLVTNENDLKKYIDKIPDQMGVILASEKLEFYVYKNAIMSNNICHGIIMKVLRKNEYLSLVKKFYGEVPDAPNTRIYKECYKLLKKINIKDLNEAFIDRMKGRARCLKLNDMLKVKKSSRQGILTN